MWHSGLTAGVRLAHYYFRSGVGTKHESSCAPAPEGIASSFSYVQGGGSGHHYQWGFLPSKIWGIGRQEGAPFGLYRVGMAA